MFLLWNALGANERGVIPCFRALGISRSVAEASPCSLELCAGVSHTHRGSEQPCSPGSHRSHRATAQLGLPTASEEPNFTERRKRSALLTWNESEPSLCDLSVQPVKELNKQPREHTPKHLSLREQLLQWGQGCQPTNPAGTTHGTGLVQPGDTHRVNFSCRTQSDSLGLALKCWLTNPQSCSSPESYWLVYLPQPLYSVGFLSQHRKWFWLSFVRVKPHEQKVLITENLQ